MNQNINISDFETDQFGSAKSGAGPINVKRLLFRALKYWYVVILCAAIGLGIAYLINRYTTKIYTVKASIIIRENKENVEGKLLYNNVLVNPYRNYFNEIYIIKSTPLLRNVVDDLGFSTSLIREGDLKETEYYDPSFPINITLIEANNQVKGKQFSIEIKGVDQFDLNKLSADGNDQKWENLSFGDTLKINGYRLLISKRTNDDIEKYFNKEYVVKFSDTKQVAKEYASRLRVSWQEANSSVLNLQINGALPGKEIDFLNELIAQYQQYDLDKKNQAATRTIGFIDKQLEEITDSLSYFEGLVEAFKQQNVVTNLDGEALRLYQRIESLETNMAQMQLQRNYYEYLTDYLQKDDDLDQVVPPSSVGVEDQIMTGLIAQLVQLQTEVKLQTSNERTESQFITRKRSQIDKIRSDLLTSVRNTLEAQQINENFLQNQIKLVQAQLIKLPESERKLVNIQRNYALSENLYIFLMQKRAEAGISKAATTSDIVIVNPPRRIGGIITPKPMQNYAVGGALGFILPIVVFGLIEFLNNRIQSKEDIEAITDIPHIGGIGHNGNESNLAVHERPKSSVAESFRSLRSNLNFFTQGKEKKVVMITSSLSGEGKTFTTINLATVLAISNKKVLIVGADMRRPRLYDDFGLTNETGLSNYLANQNEFDDIIQQTQIHNLYLVSGGPVPPNPSELLMSERMTHFIETALDKFDFVILDTPPIGLVTDAFILSEFSDHTLFLVRQDYTPAPVVKNVQELYLSGKIKNVSILFNDIKKVGPGYGYGYSYNYGYKNYRYGEYYK